MPTIKFQNFWRLAPLYVLLASLQLHLLPTLKKMDMLDKRVSSDGESVCWVDFN